MTKKHFIAFANEIKNLVRQGKFNEAEAAAAVVVNVGFDANPRFDKAVFLEACGLNS